MSTLHIILALVVFLWCVPAAYFDANSTLEFLKRGTASEAGAFGFMAWLQEKSPRGWPWIKAVLMWVLAVVVVWLLPTKAAIVILVLLNFFELVAILSNCNVSK